MAQRSPSIDDAYQYCLDMARNHYENFPVASKLLPARLREPVTAIYAFARVADDIADEGDADADTRLRQLEQMDTLIQGLELGNVPEDPIYIALADTIAHHQLPLKLFRDLLDAFKQDVTKTRYNDFDELLDYARRSANPVGRLMLHLTGNDSEQNLRDSDKICTALQLINFYQDMQQDIRENDRVYIPLTELESYELGPEDIRMENQSAAMQALMQFQIHRAQKMLSDGAGLGKRLNGRFGLEIRLIVAGGLRVCYRLSQQEDLYSRPRLTRSDWLRILFAALFKRHQADAS